jgi:hypothetical protein
MLPDRAHNNRFALLTVAIAFATAGCQFAGSPTHTPGTTLSPATPRAPAATKLPSAPATTSPSTPASSAPSKVEQAQQLLDDWARHVELAGSAPITFPDGLIRGGGWHGDNANDSKIAFLNGSFHEATTLSTETPEDGEIVWSNGKSQTVELLSASEAFRGLIANSEGGTACDECPPLEVTGAHLTTVDAATTEGDARVPAWEFVFQPDQRPLQPISIVAVWGANGWPGANLGGATNDGMPAQFAYGRSDSRELTVSFVGSPWAVANPCGADYTAQAVESDLAVAVIIEEHGSNQPAQACPALGGLRTAVVQLSRPLGDRTVLDVNYAVPVKLKNEAAPSVSPLP